MRQHKKNRYGPSITKKSENRMPYLSGIIDDCSIPHAVSAWPASRLAYSARPSVPHTVSCVFFFFFWSFIFSLHEHDSLEQSGKYNLSEETCGGGTQRSSCKRSHEERIGAYLTCKSEGNSGTFPRPSVQYISPKDANHRPCVLSLLLLARELRSATWKNYPRKYRINWERCGM